MNLFYNNYNSILENIFFDVNSKIHVSFEFFPPKVDSIQNTKFLSCIQSLSLFKPDFISITCNNDIKINNYTYNSIIQLKKILNLNIAPHITYINSNSNEIKQLAKNYWDSGIRNIVALRGDFSKDSNSVVYASDLVYLLKKVANFNIYVAAYPEIHPESKNMQEDLGNLKKKIDIGADAAITQFFFDVNNYLRFRDRCIAIGIHADIIPGIMPILDFKQLHKFASMTNVYIPTYIKNMFDTLDAKDTKTTQMIGLVIATHMINILYQSGVRKFHFYTLNQMDIVYSLCCMLGLKK